MMKVCFHIYHSQIVFELGLQKAVLPAPAAVVFLSCRRLQALWPVGDLALLLIGSVKGVGLAGCLEHFIAS